MNGPGGQKVKRHSRSQSADVSQLEVGSAAVVCGGALAPSGPPVCFFSSLRVSDEGQVERMRERRSRGQGEGGATAGGTPPRSQAKHMGPTPRSPRTNVLGRPSRDRIASETKKKRETVAAERVFMQMATNGNGGPATGEQRRYVDSSPPGKRSHRRAVSLSTNHELPLGAVKAATSNASTPSVASTNSSQFTPDARRRSQRRPQPHTMRAPKTSSSQLSSSSSQQSQSGSNSPQKKLSLRLVELQRGHRRANSWDPRGAEEGHSVSPAALEQALASRKAELAERERRLLERQSRQEAELKSLSQHDNVEREVEELLRLQRKLKTSPDRREAGNIRSPPMMRSPPMTEDPDSELMSELDGLNQELEQLKLRTRSIENRVRELRCPGPTPLEMMTGGTIHSVKKGTLRGSDAFSSDIRRSNVRKVQARRSPVVIQDRSRAESPDQSKRPPAFGKTPSFHSAFSPIGEDY